MVKKQHTKIKKKLKKKFKRVGQHNVNKDDQKKMKEEVQNPKGNEQIDIGDEAQEPHIAWLPRKPTHVQEFVLPVFNWEESSLSTLNWALPGLDFESFTMAEGEMTLQH